MSLRMHAARSGSATSGWAPLRHPEFRRLWTAQFTSNVGSWMQTVAAQWVMTSPTRSAVLLAAISAAAFVFLASGIWALLPLVARDRLGLGSGGYGFLLGCVGLGALLAATFGPSLRERLSPRVVYAVACLAVAVGAALLAVTHSVAVAVVGLILAGAAWITGLGLLSSGYQSQLPPWVKARSFAYYLVAFQGAAGIGALCLGTVAQAARLTTALLIVGGGLAGAVLGTWRLPLPGGADTAAEMCDPLPLPELAGEIDVAHEPVLITVEYRVAAGHTEDFLALAGELRRLRRRTGALRWHLHRDVEDRDLFIETFLVGSWEQHELQHARLQRPDAQVLAQIDSLLEPGHPRRPHHALGVAVSHRSKRD